MAILVNGQYKNYTSIRINLLGVNAAPYVTAINYKTKDEFSPVKVLGTKKACLLYTSPSPRDRQKSRMPSSA